MVFFLQLTDSHFKNRQMLENSNLQQE